MRKGVKAALVPLLLMALGSYWHPDPRPWTVTQLTESITGINHTPQLSDDGKTIYFVSTCDLARRNSDYSPEIFKWRQGEITQLTETPNCIITDLRASPDSQRLAFASSCYLNGKNPGRGLELAVMNHDGSIQVLTQGGGMPSRYPQWSPGLKHLVFQSNADLTQKNSDFSTEIFVADLETTPVTITQLTNTISPYQCEEPQALDDSVICRCNDDVPGTPRPPDVSDLTTIINGRPAAGNPDHNWEILTFDFEGNPRMITQTKNCENSAPVLRRDGKIFAFTSNCSFSGSPTQPTARELYFQAAKLIRPFPNYNFDGVSLSWSVDGSRLAFTSSAAYGQVNLDHNPEIFVLNLPDRYPAGLAQAFAGKTITDLVEPVSDFQYVTSDKAALSADGSAAAFISTANLKGHNPDGNFELFMARRESEEGETTSGLMDGGSEKPAENLGGNTAGQPQTQPGATSDVIKPPGHVAPPSLTP